MGKFRGREHARGTAAARRQEACNEHERANEREGTGGGESRVEKATVGVRSGTAVAAKV